MAFKRSLLPLLLLGAAAAAAAAAAAEEGPSVQEIVNSRLIAGFKDGCNPEEASLRSLGIAVRAAYGEKRKLTKFPEAASAIVMDVRETGAEDFSTYSRRQTSFELHLAQSGDDYLFVGTSFWGLENPQKCVVSRQHLKRVGVSIISFSNCPLLLQTLETPIRVFQNDSCVLFVEKDSVVHAYPTIEGPPVDEEALVNPHEPWKPFFRVSPPRKPLEVH
ncbi:hypothetical protein ETH_00018790 [Eimeria tenella]|uniref:Uncharacterized protein n=1 Tax=Eimeria tenella TaxID=5802 RepID=U6L158_EIMTE|nr:hypothetical protein ETH_00018790 [Eimeria tenella]CDJ42339.1 hypothetical protein ETH_00018790 [Eimeria tenella]|eukprot:XP_013233089.1 hypothetical protein ETH_00018790 [Eimeria tenella]